MTADVTSAEAVSAIVDEPESGVDAPTRFLPARGKLPTEPQGWFTSSLPFTGEIELASEPAAEPAPDASPDDSPADAVPYAELREQHRRVFLEKVPTEDLQRILNALRSRL